MEPTASSDEILSQTPSDRTSQTDDERIAAIVPLPPPAHLIRFFPIQGTPVEALVARTRANVKQILRGESDRLLVVIGPCSIHDPAAAVEYAGRLAEVRTRLADDLEIVMRVYFEKPRTTVGWKGLINDPYLDGTFRINEGLRIARDVLLRIHQVGVPAGSEFLDTISPQYIGDLISWGAIGCADHRIAGPPRTSLGVVGADRLQEWNRRKRQGCLGRDHRRRRATPLPLRSQEWAGGHRRDARELRLPSYPPRRPYAQLRRENGGRGLRSHGGGGAARKVDDRLLACEYE